MTDQERRVVRRAKPSEETSPATRPATAEKGDKIKKSLDAVLDEIDTVLEQNAEEFVRSYVQRGGQ
jgi:ubiquitin-like protein Pup